MASQAAKDAAAFFRSIESPSSGPEAGTPSYKHKDDLAYALSLYPMGTKRHVKVICVGGGFSGLCLAKAVDTGKLSNTTLTIFEKNAEVGGTWFENRYPGCACDIPIHNYQLTWAPNPWFRSYYATAPEIQQYLVDVSHQHHLRKYFKLSHKVTGAKWIEEKQKWQVQVVRTDGRDVSRGPESHEDEIGESFIEECDVLVNAGGVVNDWKWPTTPGREKFKGEVVHSAAWPKDFSVKGKTVALIGNGSSGVQILPAILEDAKKIYVHVRSKTWVTIGFAPKFAGPHGDNIIFTEEQKKQWASDPEAYLQYRKAVELELNSRFRMFLRDSAEQKVALEFCKVEMEDKLGARPELIETLMPDFAVGCRRPTPGNGYLEALCSDKVEVIWGEIDEFTEKGIKPRTGKISEVDAIICATGFDISFCPRFPILGRNGIDLQQEWRDKTPAGYLSVAAANMPNYFTYVGPPGPLIHGSIVAAMEFITDYIVKMVSKMQVENYGSVMLKDGVADAWLKHTLAWIQKTAWADSCSNTYRNGTKDRPLFSIHPGSRLHYFYLLQNPRYEDFDWTSLCPDPDLRYAWFGDGFTYDETYQHTKTRDKDQTYFLQLPPKDAYIKSPDEAHELNGEVNGEQTVQNS